MTGRCTRWKRWLIPGNGGRLKVLNWNLQSFQLLEIIHVLDSISWVRCASGNVLGVIPKCLCQFLFVGQVMYSSDQLSQKVIRI